MLAVLLGCTPSGDNDQATTGGIDTAGSRVDTAGGTAGDGNGGDTTQQSSSTIAGASSGATATTAPAASTQPVAAVPTLSQLSLSPRSSVSSGSPLRLTISLTAAIAEDASVAFTSSSPATINVPATGTVLANTSALDVPLTAGVPGTTTLTASLNGTQKSINAEVVDVVRFDIHNGWLVHNGRVIWGYGQHNSWWTPTEGANITRNDPGAIGPGHTEDLDKLTDNMLLHAYPAFEHNYGLWYDRRRDKHDTDKRTNPNVVPPFLEQPWARSGAGTAWDGLSRYDLTRYNPWYFDRLKAFSTLCDAKGAVLFHNFYMQHALLEYPTHYVDFPWRPVNCIQATGMPDGIPAANAFYNISDPVRRDLHRAYIYKCLDELGGYSNVFHLCSQEYTGPLSFMQFWLDTVSEWEVQNNTDVKVCLGGTKDVLDALAGDPRVSALDLRYFWYYPSGSQYAPQSGREVAGRYTAGVEAARTTPYQIYRQVKEYRLAYPDKPIIHMIDASRQQSWAFLMGGGSVLLRFMRYPGSVPPPDYTAPTAAAIIQPTYDFINMHMADLLPHMTPADLVNNPESNWCLADPGQTYLVYALNGGRIDLDLTSAAGKTLRARWLDPRTGSLTPADSGQVQGGSVPSFTAPDANDWALFLDLP